jgi:hypothetical protein
MMKTRRCFEGEHEKMMEVRGESLRDRLSTIRWNLNRRSSIESQSKVNLGSKFDQEFLTG